MVRIQVPGGSLEADAQGSGEPLLLIHGSIIGPAMLPLLSEPALKSRFRLIHYFRRGFAPSSKHTGPFSIADQAADALAVLRHFGVERAHVAGHSYGGAIALQLAVDAPTAVHSIALMEPALVNFVPGGAAFGEGLAAMADLYASGDRALAADGFMQAVGGADYQQTLKHLPPGWYAQAVDEIDTFFEVEVPALGAWEFPPDVAKRIRQPKLSILALESGELFREMHELCLDLWPGTASAELPGLPHPLQMVDPVPVAEALANFFVKEPMAAATSRR